MNKFFPSLTGLSLLSTLFLQAPFAAADPAVTRWLASPCAQCHGTNGYSQSDFDSIAGEEARDMFKDMADMKKEDSPENIMDHQALGYTDAQIWRIAAYYAGLPEDDPFSLEENSEDAFDQVDPREEEYERDGGDEREVYEEDEEDEEDEEAEEDEED